MDPRSLQFKPTAEDRLTMQTWKWRLAAVYGAVLVFLVLMVAAAPRHRSDLADTRGAPDFSGAATAEGRAMP